MSVVPFAKGPTEENFRAPQVLCSQTALSVLMKITVAVCACIMTSAEDDEIKGRVEGYVYLMISLERLYVLVCHITLFRVFRVSLGLLAI